MAVLVLFLLRVLPYAALICLAFSVYGTGVKLRARICGWIVGLAVFGMSLFLGAGGGGCSDGWASPSIGRQGACSHHGGADKSGAVIATIGLFAGVYAGAWVAKKLD